MSLAVVLTPAPAQARDWLVPAQAPTIQAAIDSCVQGDVVLISPGTYNDCTHMSENVLHIAVLKSGVSLRGSTGDPTDVILDAEGNGRCLEMRNLTGTVEIEGLTLRGGHATNPFGSGGGVFIYDSEPVFRTCIVDSNYADYAGGGICVLFGGMTVEDCVFVANETAVLGAAMRISNSPSTITGTTIHGSIGEAIHYTTDEPTIARCLITNGTEQTFVRNSSGDPAPVITCSDFFGNDEDWPEFIADQADQEGNLTVDPQYCNPLFGEFSLYTGSPCAEENSGTCGLIGALPAVCGTGSAYHLVRADGMGDFPTIQAAINAAASGDTVALADGTYTGDGNRNLDYLGKAITITGQSGDPDLAVIDCQGSIGDPQRGFYFHTSETRFSVLRDVTITNADVAGDGAGILCESSPTIINCVFVLNHADRGAGIFCRGGSPEVIDCLFTRNEGRSKGGGMGFLSSEAILRSSTFTENWGALGSAIFLPDSSSVTIETTTMTSNNCSLDKGMIGVDGNSSLTMDRTIVSFGNNHAVRTYDTGSITVTNCNVFGNDSSDYSLPISAQRNQDGNISADPHYCNVAAGDLTLRNDSPCSELNAWNGEVIGAHPVGCDADPIFASASAALNAPVARSRGVSWVDLNADGNLDCFVANLWASNEVYLGDGAGGFTPHVDGALQFPGSTVGGQWADWNNDGDLDLYMCNSGMPNLLADVDGGIFSLTGINGLAHVGPAGGSTWLDFDNDGFLDLFIAATDSTSAMMRNNTIGAFVAMANFAQLDVGGVQHAIAADYDLDGDRDLYLVQDGEANLLVDYEDGWEFGNAGDAAHNSTGRSAAWGDYDNDEDLDLFVVNDGNENLLLENRNGANFIARTEGVLKDDGPGRSGIWGDWDNDGDLDLFLTNCGGADRLFRNEGDKLFVDTVDPTFAAADSSTGAAWGDYDDDGDLDLLVADQSGATRLYRNDQSTGNHWIKVDLIHSNGALGCLGARVRVVTGDTVQIREVGASAGWLSQDSPTVHIGLGAATTIDSLQIILPEIVWPVLVDVVVDQTLILTATGTSPVYETDPETPGALRPGIHSCYPNPFNPTTTIRFALPTRGPASLHVYDVAGRLVRTVFDETRPAGMQQAVWAGRDQSDRGVASGVYYMRLQAVGVAEVRSVVLVK